MTVAYPVLTGTANLCGTRHSRTRINNNKDKGNLPKYGLMREACAVRALGLTGIMG